MKLPDKVYDVLKWLTVICLPALGAAYLALAAVWGWPYPRRSTTRAGTNDMTGGRADMEYYSTARGKLPDELETLLLDERVAAIKQAGLGRLDEQIAMRYFIERLPQADVAAIVGRERSTVTRRLKEITPRVRHTAELLAKLPQ